MQWPLTFEFDWDANFGCREKGTPSIAENKHKQEWVTWQIHTILLISHWLLLQIYPSDWFCAPGSRYVYSACVCSCYMKGCCDWVVCSCTCDTVDAAVVTALIHILHRVVCFKLTASTADFRWDFGMVAMETDSQNTLAIPLNTLATT